MPFEDRSNGTARNRDSVTRNVRNILANRENNHPDDVNGSHDLRARLGLQNDALIISGNLAAGLRNRIDNLRELRRRDELENKALRRGNEELMQLLNSLDDIYDEDMTALEEHLDRMIKDGEQGEREARLRRRILELENENEQLKTKNDALRSRKNDLENKNYQLEIENDDLWNENEKRRKNILGLRSALHSFKGTLKTVGFAHEREQRGRDPTGHRFYTNGTVETQNKRWYHMRTQHQRSLKQIVYRLSSSFHHKE